MDRDIIDPSSAKDDRLHADPERNGRRTAGKRASAWFEADFPTLEKRAFAAVVGALLFSVLCLATITLGDVLPAWPA